ncbi:MAG: hypothetical protein RBS43_00435 [Candidatus Cloacimonas sp.]|jgi:WD40 repeat protein|nr:hypothetical protein [Candidatus Cloacimonas sp.]
MKKNKEKPEIYMISKDNQDNSKVSRKRFLGTVGISAALLALNPVLEGETNQGTSNLVQAPTNKNAGIVLESGNSNLFKAHAKAVLNLAFSPKGQFLASVGADEKLKVWGMPDVMLAKTINIIANILDPLIINPDGSLMALKNAGGIMLWNTESWDLQNVLEEKNTHTKQYLFCTESSKLLTQCDKGKIHYWDVPNLNLSQSTQPFSGVLDISADGKMFAALTDDNKISINQLPDGKLIKQYDGHNAQITMALFSPSGKALITYDTTGLMKLWDLQDIKTVAIREWIYQNANSLIFSPSGKNLVTISGSVIKVWSIPDGVLRATLNKHTNNVNSASFSSDGKYLASGDVDGIIRLWEMPQGTKNWLIYDQSLMKPVNVLEVKEQGAEIITMPCGSVIPAKATCICNCIESSKTYQGTKTICTCNTVLVPAGSKFSGTCVCNTISVGIQGINDAGTTRTTQTKGTVCTCNTICTCNTVCSCDSHTNSYHYWYPN